LFIRYKNFDFFYRLIRYKIVIMNLILNLNPQCLKVLALDAYINGFVKKMDEFLLKFAKEFKYVAIHYLFSYLYIGPMYSQS